MTIEVEFKTVVKRPEILLFDGQEVTVYAEVEIIPNCDCDGRELHPHAQDVIIHSVTDEEGDEVAPGRGEFEEDAISVAYAELEIA
jgi:hypothetical protein